MFCFSIDLIAFTQNIHMLSDHPGEFFFRTYPNRQMHVYHLNIFTFPLQLTLPYFIKIHLFFFLKSSGKMSVSQDDKKNVAMK